MNRDGKPKNKVFVELSFFFRKKMVKTLHFARALLLIFSL